MQINGQPAVYLGDPRPSHVIIALHGHGQSAARFARRWQTLVDDPIPGVGVLLIQGATLDERGKRVWVHELGSTDYATVLEAVGGAKKRGADTITVAGESYGASMVWWLLTASRAIEDTVDQWAPCNCPIPAWVAPRRDQRVYHTLGARDRRLFSSTAQVHAAADAARAWGADPVRVYPRGGHRWREADSRALAEMGR